jgi:hypothetical protein
VRLQVQLRSWLLGQKHAGHTTALKHTVKRFDQDMPASCRTNPLFYSEQPTGLQHVQVQIHVQIQIQIPHAPAIFSESHVSPLIVQ